MVTGQRIKYKNVYDEVSFITPDTATPESWSNTTLASGTTIASGTTLETTPSHTTWSKRILDPEVQNYINFVMSDISLSDVGMSDVEFQQQIGNLTSSESMQKLEQVKSFKDLVGDIKPRSIWRFQRQKPSIKERNDFVLRNQYFGDHQQFQPQFLSESSDDVFSKNEQTSVNKAGQFNELVGSNPNEVPIPSSRYTTMLPRGTHEFIDDLSDDTTEDELKFFEVIPKVTPEDIIRAVNFDIVSDHVIKTFVPSAIRPLFFKIKKFLYSLSDTIKRHAFMIYKIYAFFGNLLKIPFYFLYILSQSYHWILSSIYSFVIYIDEILSGIIDDRVIRVKLADIEPIMQKESHI